MKTLVANPTTFRRIRALVRHGYGPEDISVRLLCGLSPLKAFCVTHNIELVPVVDAPSVSPVKTGADFDSAPRASSNFTVTLGRGTIDAIEAEAVRRGTTAAKLAAKILLLVSAPHERGENLFAAVLDY